jgi:hypothetical protein
MIQMRKVDMLFIRSRVRSGSGNGREGMGVQTVPNSLLCPAKDVKNYKKLKDHVIP